MIILIAFSFLLAGEAKAVERVELPAFPASLKAETVMALPGLKGGLLGASSAAKDLEKALKDAEGARKAASDASFSVDNKLIATWPSVASVETNIQRVMKDWGRAKATLLTALDTVIAKAGAAKATTVVADATQYKAAVDTVTVPAMVGFKVAQAIDVWEVLNPAGQVVRLRRVLAKCRTALDGATTLSTWAQVRTENIRGVGALVKSVTSVPAPVRAFWALAGTDPWMPAADAEIPAKAAEVLQMINNTEAALGPVPAAAAAAAQ